MTPLDPDLELRLAAFDHVAKLRDRFGGLIPSSALKEGFTFHGQPQPVWNHQQGIYKPKSSEAALSIHTSIKSPYDDYHHGDDGVLIYRYRGKDVSHYQNRSLQRAFERGLPLIYFFAVDKSLY